MKKIFVIILLLSGCAETDTDARLTKLKSPVIVVSGRLGDIMVRDGNGQFAHLDCACLSDLNPGDTIK